MNTRHATDLRRCTVYHGHGEPLAQAVDVPEFPEGHAPHKRTISSVVTVRQIMSNEVVCARADLAIGAVVKLMIEQRLGCLPIVDARRRPIGIITKFDLVEHVDASIRTAGDGGLFPPDLRAGTAEDVMMPLAITLSEHATVGQAAAIMTAEDTHHVLIVSSSGSLVGVVSTRDVVAWLVENDELGAGRPSTDWGDD